MDTRSNRNDQPANEVDLGVFFSALSRAFTKILNTIGYFFKVIINIIIWLLLVIKKFWIILLLSLLVGLGVAFFLYQKEGRQYYSEMTIKTNFGSSRLLYQQISYYNALIKTEEYNTIGKIFSIPANEAANLKSFSVSPIKESIESAVLYRNTFFDFKKNNNMWADTTWSKNFSYKEIETKWKDYDYPIQVVRLVKTKNSIPATIESTIINTIKNNPTLVQTKNSVHKLMQTEEAILENSLRKIDSLRNAYVKNLSSNTATGTTAERNLIIGSTNQRNAEVEIFDKEIFLKNDLIELKEKEIALNDIVEVYAGFNPSGTKLEIFQSVFLSTSIYFAVFTLSIILLIKFIKYLTSIEAKNQTTLFKL